MYVLLMLVAFGVPTGTTTPAGTALTAEFVTLPGCHAAAQALMDATASKYKNIYGAPQFVYVRAVTGRAL